MKRAIGNIGLAALLLLAGSSASAQQRTTINPVDLDYRYIGEQINEGFSSRPGAAPAFVRQRDVYYLFLTLAEGYWRSPALIHWASVTPSRWPFGGIVAPAAISDGDRLI